jgi:hypothetical protein
MISSVTKDQILLGDIKTLQDFWYQGGTLSDRLAKEGFSAGASASVSFSFVRGELERHLTGKYGFEVYIFENTPGPGGTPQGVTVFETHKSHLVIGIFGSSAGWKVPDQDPLTPTFREWRAALESPLKFKVFVLKGSLPAHKLPPALDSLMRAITDYKKGAVYAEFSDAADLFKRVDNAVRDHLNRSLIRYALDTAAKEPTAESEQWLLCPYRTRVQEMARALKRVAEPLGIVKDVLRLGAGEQPVGLHCVPDSFSIPESKKFAAYIFDDEGRDHRPDEPGRLHIVACFGGVTDLQIRRHLGNFEAAQVYSASWGMYAAEPGSGIQCVYLPRCTNSVVMQSKISDAISWLQDRVDEIALLAGRRQQILNLLAAPSGQLKVRKAAAGLAQTKGG